MPKRGLCHHAVSVCPSVCSSVSHVMVHSVETNKHSLQFFSQSGSQAILVFFVPNAMVIFRLGPPKEGVECSWRRLKSRFPTTIWLHRVLSTLRPDGCYQHGSAGPWPVVTLIACSKRRSLLMAGDDDDMFMTRSLNVTPKTTEQHLIARSDLTCSYVTNNKRLRSTFCTITANY